MEIINERKVKDAKKLPNHPDQQSGRNPGGTAFQLNLIPLFISTPQKSSKSADGFTHVSAVPPLRNELEIDREIASTAFLGNNWSSGL